jgi:hypothetical protein
LGRHSLDRVAESASYDATGTSGSQRRHSLCVPRICWRLQG